MEEGRKVYHVDIEKQMKTAYIDYSMSVIVSRALPDVRDGLKPVHRRVLFGMTELGILSNRAHKKSARIVGEVLGKYHPHGDTSVYDSMVRMAQPWAMRYMLVDGQGNFGSIDGDSPAAMRYTEARLQRISEEMTADIKKDTVDFQYNFDDTLKEPTVLPTRIPNLLVNGASGIAVGMATSMPPHNLSEVVDGINAYIDNRDITIPELMKFIKGPDFPTGCVIYGHEGVKNAFETGRGRIVMRGVSEIEEMPNGRERLVVTAIPYMVNKSEMIKKTADLVNDKKIEGISDIRDESDRKGIRVVYELKKDANTSVVLNKLYQFTPLQSIFSVNNIALVGGKPQMLNLKDMIYHFVEHRHEVVIRRTKYDLNEAEKRAHVLEGLLIALDNLDEIIALIRASKTPDEAMKGLMEKFELSEIQSRAILDMRLQKLTGLERDKVKEEYAEIQERITYYKKILNEEDLRMEIIKEELREIKEKFGDEAKSEIEYAAEDFRIEDTIPDDEVVVTISHMGYIKRTLLSEYRVQNRGGKGSRATSTRDEDFVESMFVATNHNYMLFFTENGKCFWMRVFEIPEGSRSSKGRAVQNLINIDADDTIKAFINVKSLDDKEYIQNNFIVFATRKGVIKKTPLEAFSRPRSNGINAITIRENDELLKAQLTSGNSNIIMAARSGKAIRFHEDKVRTMGRGAAGVRGIRLENEQDEVVGMVCLEAEDADILVVSEKGYGKRSAFKDYRETNRGGKGVKTLHITEKTGKLVSIDSVTDKDEIIIINKNSIMIRTAVESLRVMGRATQGVRLIKMNHGDEIAAVAKVEISEETRQEDDKTAPEDESKNSPEEENS
ncbi:MAG: DNA gyrase subunit A [Bacteroidota bacterium]